MTTALLRRTTSLAATVTMLSTLAVPAAFAADAPACAVVDGILECPATATTAEEPVEDEAIAAPVECAVIDLVLVCTPVVEVVEPEPVVDPTPVAPPAAAPTPTPEPTEVELPLSLTDGLATEQASRDCVPGIAILATTDGGDCAPAAVFAGDGSGDLGLDQLLSRGQAATAVLRLLELTDLAGMPTGADHFGDDDGTVHEGAINTLADFGIVTGTIDGRADAAGTVTGAQFASLLHRTLVHTGHVASGAVTHTAAAADLAAFNITVAGGELTRGEAASALEALLSHLQA